MCLEYRLSEIVKHFNKQELLYYSQWYKHSNILD